MQNPLKNWLAKLFTRLVHKQDTFRNTERPGAVVVFAASIQRKQDGYTTIINFYNQARLDVFRDLSEQEAQSLNDYCDFVKSMLHHRKFLSHDVDAMFPKEKNNA